MRALLRSIRHNVFGLVRFSGRDSNILFWPWVGLLVGATFAATAAVMVRAVAESFERMQRFAVEHPDQAEVVSTPTSYQVTIHGDHPELMPSFDVFPSVMGGLTFLLVGLLAGPVVRRLHDTGRTGAWGLVPLPFLAFAFAAFPRLMESFRAAQHSHQQPDLALFGLLFVNNMLYLAALAGLVILLARRGTEGPNRYGPAPGADVPAA